MSLLNRLKTAFAVNGPKTSMSVLWMLVVPIIAMVSLLLSGWHMDRDLILAIWPYAPGALLGLYLGSSCATWLAGSRPHSARFSAFVVLVSLATLGVTALIYAVHFRLYFAEFHHPFGTKVWVIQTIFTTLGSLYLFAASGVRILFPFGIVALLLAAWHFSRDCYGKSD